MKQCRKATIGTAKQRASLVNSANSTFDQLDVVGDAPQDLNARHDEAVGAAKPGLTTLWLVPFATLQ